MRGLANMLPVRTAGYVAESPFGYTILLGNSIQRAFRHGAARSFRNSMGRADISYLGFGEHPRVMLLTLGLGSVDILIGPLLGVSAPCKVARAGVRSITVEMATLVSGTGPRTVERNTNQFVNGGCALPRRTGLAKADLKISLGTDRCLLNAAHPRRPAWRAGAAHSSQIADLVRPALHGTPFFGYTINSHFRSPVPVMVRNAGAIASGRRRSAFIAHPVQSLQAA